MRRLIISALFILIPALNAISQNTIDTVLINQLLTQGDSISKTSPDSALDLYFQAEDLAKKAGDIKYLMKVYDHLRVFLVKETKYQEAIKYYKKSIELAQKADKPRDLMVYNGNLGVIYYYLGDYAKAIHYFSELEKLAIKYNDSTYLSTAYTNIGSIYSKIDETNMAMDYFRKSLRLAQKLNDENSIATAYNNIGLIYQEEGKDSIALEYFNKALKLYKKENDKEGIISVLLNSGISSHNLGNINIAIKNYEEAYKYAKGYNSRLLSDVYAKMAQMYYILSESDTIPPAQKAKYLELAKKYAQAGYNLAKEINSMDLIKQTSGVLKKYYERKNMADKALYYANIYIQAKDSLFAKHRISLIQKIEAKNQVYMQNLELEKQKYLLNLQQQKIVTQKKRIEYLIFGLIAFLALLIVIIFLFIKNQREKKKIQQLERKQSVLINNIPGYVFLKDKFLRYTYMNEKFTELTGVERDQILGKQDFEIKKKNIECEKLEKEILKTKKSVKDLEKYIEKDGKKIWLSVTKVPILNGQGEVEEILTFIQDVTEKKEVELRLKQLSIAVEQSGSIIVMTDINGNITYVNKRFTEVTGYTREEAIGQNPRILNARVQDKNFYKNLWETILSGKTWRGVFVNKKKNGEIFYEKAIITPIIQDDEIKGFIAIKEDITEERKNRQLLLEKTRQFENTISNMQDVYFRTNKDYQIIQVSKSIKDYLELESEKQVLGKTIFELLGIDKPETINKLKSWIEKSKRIEFTFKYKTAKGNYGYAESRIRVLEKSAGIEGIIRDITKRIKWERELARINRELNKKNKQIEEFTKNLTDNIKYAAVIQQAMLPKPNEFLKFFSDFFVFYKPLRIVSGDFYYLKILEDYVAVALADCTGHGVSGAFISILSYSMLNDIFSVCKDYQPDKILEALRKRINQVFSSRTLLSDGLDISLVIIEKKTLKLKFAGANHSIIVFNKDQMKIIKGDPIPIGSYPVDMSFSCKNVQMAKGDKIYMFSDGYSDQFGGKNGTKFFKRNFYELIRRIYDLPFEEQKEILEVTFENWKGNHEQIDDVTVMGLML